MILAFAYDAAEQTLAVTFVAGKRYAYCGVPAALYDQMRAALSKGEFFNAAIRDQFAYERMR